jgi:hypothetical protein
MATRITGRVPARVLRPVEGQLQPLLELSAQRFAGVLKHPVPRTEMIRKFGLDRRGCKLVAEWSRSSDEDHPVKVGDVLEVEGNTYAIVGVVDYPGCFIDLYIDDV